MGIIHISRDWGTSPSIVRVTTTDNLATIIAVGYLNTQIANINAIQNGAFEWNPSDTVSIAYDGGEGFFNFDPLTQSFIEQLPPPNSIKVQRLSNAITQNNHGFFRGDVIYFDINTLTYIYATADILADCSGILMVSNIIDVNNFEAMQTGLLVDSDYVYVPGTLYFLDDVNAGTLVPDDPIFPIECYLPCFMAISADSGYFWGGSVKPNLAYTPCLGVSRTTSYLLQMPGIYNSQVLTDTQTAALATIFSANVVYYPFLITTPTPISSLSISVNTPEAASQVTVGIYSSSPEAIYFRQNSRPNGNPLVTAVIATVAGGVNSAAFADILLETGLYWFAIQSSSDVLLSLDGSTANEGGSTGFMGMDAVNINVAAHSFMAYLQPHVYVSGVLPASVVQWNNRSLLAGFALAAFATTNNI